MLTNEGFQPKRAKNDRLPPGQYEEEGFPVLSLGPTPQVDIATWQLEARGLVERPMTWSFGTLQELPVEEVTRDIHCVTKWSKFDSHWSGVSLDKIIEQVKLKPGVTHLIAHSADGYSTNLPIEDVTGIGGGPSTSLGASARTARAWVAVAYDGEPIPPGHGGPVRLLVPHLYFWKSAKWLNALEFIDHDQPGFWEVRGYHNYGDPWQEQRYSFD